MWKNWSFWKFLKLLYLGLQVDLRNLSITGPSDYQLKYHNTRVDKQTRGASAPRYCIQNIVSCSDSDNCIRERFKKIENHWIWHFVLYFWVKTVEFTFSFLHIKLNTCYWFSRARFQEINLQETYGDIWRK